MEREKALSVFLFAYLFAPQMCVYICVHMYVCMNMFVLWCVEYVEYAKQLRLDWKVSSITWMQISDVTRKLH